MVPTSAHAALVVSLDGDRLCNGYLDGHMGARHPSDAALMSLTGIVEALRHAADFGDHSRPLYCRWSIMGGGDTTASCELRVQRDAPYTNPNDFDYIAVIGGLLP